MYCPRCHRFNLPEALRCECGHRFPLAQLLVPVDLRYIHAYLEHQRQDQKRREALGTGILGAALGFLVSLVAIPVVAFVIFILTCGFADRLLKNWENAVPYSLLLGTGIGGVLGFWRGLRYKP